VDYYRAQLVPASLTAAEFDSMISVYKTTLPHVFRVLPSSPRFSDIRSDLIRHFASLRQSGFDGSFIESLDPAFGLICKLTIDLPSLRKHAALLEFREWLSADTESGHITRQEFVSMLPPFFLDVHPTDSVLDCCAAPGSKATQVLESLRAGLLVANEIDHKRN
jgi:hypothetical protein